MLGQVQVRGIYEKTRYLHRNIILKIKAFTQRAQRHSGLQCYLGRLRGRSFIHAAAQLPPKSLQPKIVILFWVVHLYKGFERRTNHSSHNMALYWTDPVLSHTAINKGKYVNEWRNNLLSNSRFRDANTSLDLRIQLTRYRRRKASWSVFDFKDGHAILRISCQNAHKMLRVLSLVTTTYVCIVCLVKWNTAESTSDLAGQSPSLGKRCHTHVTRYTLNFSFIKYF